MKIIKATNIQRTKNWRILIYGKAGNQDGKLVKVWPSPTEVHRQLGINQGNISAVARGERNKASGFIWKYA